MREPGPTLTLLTDPDSPYRGTVGDAVFLVQPKEQKAYDGLIEALASECAGLRVHPEPWPGSDPTDLHQLFEYLRARLPRVRNRFPERELLVHISPGTPAMQTIWILMAEAGFIEQPFRLVQTLKRKDRHGRPAALDVRFGLRPFFERYEASRPREATEETNRIWAPHKFVSAPMLTLLKEARRVARLKAPVLILGERGTGKTTLAGWIRANSPFRRADLDDAWPAVACGQYTFETMRAELFGHTAQAFTGAKKAKTGLLKTAHGDTLFLDEIGDMSPDLQRLLIKAIEEKRFLPLGANKPEKTDFRLLSATNVPLDLLRERLHPDFFDRVSTFVLRLPPLRETPEELGWLWDDVLVDAAARVGVARSWATIKNVNRARLISALEASPLPGNVRDLFRVAATYLAARADDEAPSIEGDAVDQAIAAIPSTTPSAPTSATSSPHPPGSAEDLIWSCAQQRPLELPDNVRADTTGAIAALQRWVAEEISRIARSEHRPVSALADVTDRTLRSWRRNNPSD